MPLTLLEPTDYALAQALCAPLARDLAVPAMLAGETPGQVYVDDPRAPTVALLAPWDGYRVFLAGQTKDEAVIAALRDLLHAPFFTRNNAYPTVMYYADPAWEAAFPTLCAGLETRLAPRQHYTITRAIPDWAAQIPPTWRIRRVDADLLAEDDLAGLPELIAEMGSESPSREDFLTRKFGFCAQEGQRLIGWCLSEYNHGTRCEVGIATVAAWQRRGVGYIMASALIAHAISHGITQIGWHCWRGNTASAALARKLGGTLEAEYPVLLCRAAGG